MLVTHYFGGKRDLFLAVVELPLDPGAVFEAVLTGDHDSAGAPGWPTGAGASSTTTSADDPYWARAATAEP